MKKRMVLIKSLLVVCSAIVQAKADISDSVTILAKPKEYFNSVIFSGSDYYGEPFRRFGNLLIWQDAQIGIYYERKFFKQFRIKAGYNQWNTKWYPLNFPHEYFYTPQLHSLQKGTITASAKYKMVDLFVTYRYNKFKRHKISTGIGTSFTWGLNEVVDSIVAYPGFKDAVIYSHAVKKSYYGIVPIISYDYIWLRYRINVGIDIKYRKYFGFYLSAFEYGAHLGFNF